MKFFIYKSGEGGKIILFVLFVGVRLLYSYFFTSSSAKSNQELDEEEDETIRSSPISYGPTLAVNKPPLVAVHAVVPQKSASVAKVGIGMQPEVGSLSHLVGGRDKALDALSYNPRLQRRVVTASKIYLGRKRPFFKRALLLHALIERKDFWEMAHRF